MRISPNCSLDLSVLIFFIQLWHLLAQANVRVCEIVHLLSETSKQEEDDDDNEATIRRPRHPCPLPPPQCGSVYASADGSCRCVDGRVGLRLCMCECVHYVKIKYVNINRPAHELLYRNYKYDRSCTSLGFSSLVEEQCATMNRFPSRDYLPMGSLGNPTLM